MWIPIIGGLLGLGALGALLARARPRSALVLYANNLRTDAPGDRGTFRQAGELAARALGVQAVPVTSGQEVLDAIRRAPGNLGVVVMIGHGTPSLFFEPRGAGIRIARRGGTALPDWISAADLARALAPKLARNAIISYAGCTVGRDEAEPSEWGVNSTAWDGGTRNLAMETRDALALLGVTGEVRAHTTRGSVLDNPQGRAFTISRDQIGRPGIHVMRLAGRPQPRTHEEYAAWNSYARGRIALGWMLGRPIPRG